ncbi:MAG: hypothetical protein J6B88_01680 [Clostridia bacterium]|nr:hypothetical protein [Clostridia bacterium]
MEIKEKFTTSKTGDENKNEDAIFVSERIIAVIDGATSKTGMPLGANISSGTFAANALCTALKNICDEILQPEDIVIYLNDSLKKAVEHSVFKNSKEPPAASIIMYDKLSGKIVSYGDCQFLKNGQCYQRRKKIDEICAEKRAKVLSELISKKGFSISELLENDYGRESIKPLILESFLKYANTKGEYGFPVLGYGEIVLDYIDVFEVEEYEEIVFASDGYPVLKATLKESEAYLKKIIQEDPLLYKHYKATKGLAKNAVSFDDRTFVRFIV